MRFGASSGLFPHHYVTVAPSDHISRRRLGGGETGMTATSTRAKRRFQLVLIKPSHYDDDGYVIQWMRAFVPSNTLAVLYSLGRDSGQRNVLGPDTAIDITVIDEIHTRVKIDKLLALFRRHGGFGLVAHRRRPVQSVSARARHRPPVPCGGRAGDDRRISCVRLPRDAARNAGRPARRRSTWA